MPTNFTSGMLEDGDIIYASHVNQLMQPIQDLEEGTAYYRKASLGENSHYEVNFTAAENPGGSSISSLKPGQIIVFKASHDSLAGKNLIVLTDTGQESYPLYIGGQPVASGDISAFQIVAAIFNDGAATSETLPARFDVIGVGESGGSGGGSSTLAALTDVDVSQAQENDVLQRDNSGNYVSKTMASAGIASSGDIANLQTQIDGKSDDPHNHEISSVNGLQAALDGKQENLPTGTDGQVLQTNSSGGVEWVTPSASGGGASQLSGLSDVDDNLAPADGEILQHNGTQFVSRDPAAAGLASSADITGLQGQIDGKQDTLTAPGDVPGLDTALGAKQDSLTGTADVPGLDTALGAKQDSLTGTADVPGLDTALGAKQDSLTGTVDVPGLDGALNGKEDKTNKGSAGGYAGLDAASGAVPISQGGTNATDAVAARTNLGAQAQHSNLDQVSAVSMMKGDIFVHDGASITKLASGSDGQVLKAKASNPSGLEWADESVGGGGGGDTSIVYGFASKASQTSSSGLGVFVWDVSDSFVSEMTLGSNYVQVPSLGTYRITMTANASLDSGQCSIGLGINSSTAMNSDYKLDGEFSISGWGASINNANCPLSGTWFVELQGGDQIYGLYSGTNVSLTQVSMTLEKLQPSAISYDTVDVGQVPVGAEGDVMTTVSGTWQAQAPSTPTITPGDLPSGIDASKISSGSVSNVEFDRLNGVTSSIQGQLNSKVSGSGSSNRLALWSGSGSLTSNSNFEVDNNRLVLGNIPPYSSSGAVVYAYTSGLSNPSRPKGTIHHWSSSRRYKKEIKDMESVAEKVRCLKPVRYKGTAPSPDGTEKEHYEDAFGLIAEDVAEIFPDLCYKLPGDEKRGAVSGIHYDRLPIYLLAAWRELLEKCEQLEEEVRKLKKPKKKGKGR